MAAPPLNAHTIIGVYSHTGEKTKEYSGDNLCPALPANRGCTPPSKPWVHTSSKTRLQHKLADTRAKQRTLRVRPKKPAGVADAVPV